MTRTRHRTDPARRTPGAGRLALLLAAALGAAALGCGSDEAAPPDRATTATAPPPAPEPLPAPVQSLDIAGTEYAFEVDDAAPTLSPGWTRVSFENKGEEAHQVMFARLKDGVDLGQLATVAGDDSSGSAAIEFVDMLGGVSYVGPGQRVDTLVDLPSGTVMAMCYVPDPDGVAHAISGMTTMLTVEPDDGSDAPSETADGEPVRGTIRMGAAGYDIPADLPAGWYRVVNEDGEGASGQGLHELSILGLDSQLDPNALDVLLGDLAANETPDIPLVALGGMGALSPGFEGYVHLDLAPGEYLAVDFMPDPGNPRPHLLDGYATLFEP